jgi:predicted nuclease of predicted toxin-antitoxin system
MPPKLRFHLDENVNDVIAEALRKKGIDVTTTPEKSMHAYDDTDQLAFAKSEGRVLITHDTDFLAIAAKDFDHPGIIFCKMRGHSLGNLILEISSIYGSMTPEEMIGNVEYL